MNAHIAEREQPRVLLVDDTDAMRHRAAALLSSACVIVGTAKDGPEALEASAALRPDVIVLDISLNGMSGLDVLANLRKAGSTAAVVFITVYEDEELIRVTRVAGGLGYVVKRRLASELVTAVLEARAGRPFVSKIAPMVRAVTP